MRSVFELAMEGAGLADGGGLSFVSQIKASEVSERREGTLFAAR